jgi:hypothetical protein
MGFPPSVSGHAVVKALDKETDAAHRGDRDREQAALDETELREIERAEYYHDAPSVTDAASASVEVAPHRSLLDRLFRR